MNPKKHHGIVAIAGEHFTPPLTNLSGNIILVQDVVAGQ